MILEASNYTSLTKWKRLLEVLSLSPYRVFVQKDFLLISYAFEDSHNWNILVFQTGYVKKLKVLCNKWLLGYDSQEMVIKIIGSYLKVLA